MKLTLKRPDHKESVLMVRMMINGTAMKFYTGKTIQCKNWSKSKQEVLSGEENHKLINQYLDNWKIELKRIIAEKQANQIRLNKEEIDTQLDRHFKKENETATHETEINDFISFIEDYNKKKITSKGNLQRLNQTKNHIIFAFNLITKKHLLEWENLSSKARANSILKADFKFPFEDINLKFIENFRSYFFKATFTIKVKGEFKTQHYKINHIDKHLKAIKQFITIAIENGYVKKFTWTGIKSESKDVDSVFTDFSEIQMYYDEPLTKPTEILVRDKYVLNCFLGMRYNDFNKLKPHFFSKQEIKGKEYLVYTGRAKKTDYKIEFALHPIAQEILEKYNYSIPELSAKEFNKVIKVVSHRIGLRYLVRIREIRGNQVIFRDVPKYELMSSHAGRRSFCTNFYNEGVSIAAIMSISGHQTEAEFRKYIKKASVRLEIVAEQISAIKGINISKAA